jgi:hypothetical protein
MRTDGCWLLAASLLLCGATVPTECMLTLTTDAPRGTCAVPEGEPRLVQIPVHPLRNPGMEPVNVQVGLLPAAGGEIVIQSMSLFPVDQPAVFVVRLPHFRAPARIVITLLPGTPPLAVTVGPLAYQYEEPR